MKNKTRKQPWRIAVFALSVCVIVYLWAEKDIKQILASTPREDVAPLIATALAVSLIKVGVIAMAVNLVRWMIGKVKDRKKEKGGE